MSDTHYQKIFHVKSQIKDLGFEPRQLVGIAAALTSKFTLVPKDLGLEEDDEGNELEVELEDDDEDAPLSRPKPMSARRIANRNGPSANQARKIEERRKDAEALAEIPPDEQEAIKREWGMEQGSKENVPLDISDSSLDPELASAIMNIDGLGMDPDMPGPVAGGQMGADARHAALLARANAAKSDSTQFRVRRVDP